MIYFEIFHAGGVKQLGFAQTASINTYKIIMERNTFKLCNNAMLGIILSRTPGRARQATGV